ncbi:unnamed protein product [Linum trigynum]|uniref:Uncharacterized protein n=1 Tax=Linum trigynum TaxID=586398 RepID=A0AAV2G0G2_9ROSI
MFPSKPVVEFLQALFPTNPGSISGKFLPSPLRCPLNSVRPSPVSVHCRGNLLRSGCDPLFSSPSLEPRGNQPSLAVSVSVPSPLCYDPLLS